MLRFRDRRMLRRRLLVRVLTAAILKSPELQLAFNEVEDGKAFVERLKSEIEKYPRVLTTQ